MKQDDTHKHSYKNKTYISTIFFFVAKKHFSFLRAFDKYIYKV